MCPGYAVGVDTLFEIALTPLPTRPAHATRSLYEQIRNAIADGRLPPGTKLPATRIARTIFGVSRGTVAQVYGLLLTNGFVVSKQGSGTYVAHRSKQRRRAPKANSPGFRLNPFWQRGDISVALGFWASAADLAPSNRLLDFRPALLDPRLFPTDVLRRLTARELRRIERRPPRTQSPYGHQGHYRLRQAISTHVAVTRAVVCEPEDLLITSGAQQAFDLLARVLVTPHETVVAMENPGYPPMRIAFAAAGAIILPIPVDNDGMQIDALPHNVSIICTCPSHQFPLGGTMSKRRRQALLSFARAHGAVVIEDDYDGEIRHQPEPLPALKGAADADSVFYVGSFSKCMMSGLRLGFIAAPAWAMPSLVAAKNCTDWHSSLPMQLAVASFISEGHLRQHLQRLRTLLKERRSILLELLRSWFTPVLTPLTSAYGMHITALSSGRIDLEQVSARCLERNINIHTLSRYYMGPKSADGLVFGYGALEPHQIRLGLTTLRELMPKKQV